MSVTGRLSRVLRRRSVQVAVAIVALGGAVTAVAVANIALLEVAGGAQDQVGGLSSRLDLAPASAPATTTAATSAAPAAPPVSPARDDDHGGVDTDRDDEATEAGDD